MWRPPDDACTSAPGLARDAGEWREAWRCEEETWARAALERWWHERTLVERVRDLAHGGDTIAVTVASTVTFVGVVVAVGLDVAVLTTSSGPVDVRLASDVTGAPAPVVVRVVQRARSGGRRADPGPLSLRTRLLAHETAGVEVVVGTAAPPGEERGLPRLGRDHVTVLGHDAVETLIPLAWVAWVAPVGDMSR